MLDALCPGYCVDGIYGFNAADEFLADVVSLIGTILDKMTYISPSAADRCSGPQVSYRWTRLLRTCMFGSCPYTALPSRTSGTGV